MVARLLAEKWSATLEEVLAVSDVSVYPDFKYVVIGTVDGKRIERSAHILRNPHARPRSSAGGTRRKQPRKKA
jgi:hypothetical protein